MGQIIENSHSHHHHHQVFRETSARILWIALIILGVFFFIEIIGGVLTNSLALISDAAHLLTDVAAVGLSLFAQWFAKKPPSARRTFGYYRVEILAALLNGFSLIVVALFIALEAYHRFSDPPRVLGWPMVIVAALGLVAQLATTLILRQGKEQSLNVRSAYLHAMTDVLQSIGVIAGGLVILATSWYLIDPLISMMLALFVGYSGGKILFAATHVLIEGTPPEIDLDRIALAITKIPGVLRVTDLHAWTLTTGYNALSAHVLITPFAEKGSHEALQRQITQELCATFPLHHVTLQVEQECDMCNSNGCGDWLDKPFKQ